MSPAPRNLDKSVCVIGVGYVGLVAGTCLSDFGLNVYCVDRDKKKIDMLKSGICPIYEVGLEDLIKRNQAKKRLHFSTDLKTAVKNSSVIFLAVGTPLGKDHWPDLKALKQVAVELARYIEDYKVIAIRSTVPPGTAREIKKLIQKNLRDPVEIDLVSNPEFLREGSAIQEFTHPDRVILGSDSRKALEIVKEIYRPLYLIETPFVITNFETAEIIKYSNNTFLAAKISFINEIALLCEETGADVQVVAKALGLDGRIGSKFLHAGAGFGGSCLPKDVMGLTKVFEKKKQRFHIGQSVIQVNLNQRKRVVQKIQKLLGNLKGKRIGILGLSFKPNTDDVREAPALDIIRGLQQQKARIKAYDPVAILEAKKVLKNVEFCKDPYQVAAGSDGLVLVTEWNEFRELNLEKIKRLMKAPNFVDARNVYIPEQMRKLGFNYSSIGR